MDCVRSFFLRIKDHGLLELRDQKAGEPTGEWTVC